MRQSFDKSVPLWEQMRRIVKSHTGRKHQHRIGPGKKAMQDQKAATAAMRKRVKAKKRFTAMVNDYFNGKRDTHP